MALKSGVSPADAEALRLKGNDAEDAADSLKLIGDVAGLKPQVFEGKEFTIFPCAAASLRFSAQTIGSGTTYAVPTVDTTSLATWTYGVVLDTANARVQVPGLPGDSLLLFVLWWRWDPNATNRRALQWTDNSGNNVEDNIAAFATYNNYCHITHVRRMASADTWYQLQVWQNSGGDLDGDGLLTVFRMR
jgi:hypothetical protein